MSFQFNGENSKQMCAQSLASLWNWNYAFSNVLFTVKWNILLSIYFCCNAIYDKEKPKT